MAPPPLNLSLLNKDKEQISLAGHFAMLRDKTGNLTISDVVDGTVPPSDFLPAKDIPTAGYTSDTVWLKVTLTTDSIWQPNLTLIAQPPFLHVLDIYVPKTSSPGSSEDFTVFHRGTFHEDQQPGNWKLFYTAPLTLPVASEATLYFRISTGSTVTLKASIATTAGLLDYSLRWMSFSASLIALSVIALLISLFFWLQSRRRFFLSFAGLMFSNAFLVACHSNLLPGFVGATGDILFSIASLLIVLGNLVFIYDQIFPGRAPRWMRHCIVGAMVYNLFGFANLYFEIVPYTMVITPLMLAAVLSVLVLVAYYLRIYLRTRRPGSLTALLAQTIQTGFAVSSVVSLLGGADILRLGERDYWVTMGPFTVLMGLSMVIRGNHLYQRRKIGISQRMAQRAERRANVLAEERTAALRQAKTVAEEALVREKLGRAEQARFVDIIRHQYQTPLAVIRNSASTLLSTLPPDDHANRDRLGRIEVATRDLREVLQVSLSRARLEETGAAVRFEPVALGELLAAAVERCRTLHRRHAIRLDLPDRLAETELRLDRRMVAVALDNLIGNASKFSPDDSEILVSAVSLDTGIAISVKDQGIGIPEDELASVTDRYYRASNTGNVSGTGLGLHIASEVAKAHGASLAIANADRRGVVATLTFPTHRPPG